MTLDEMVKRPGWWTDAACRGLPPDMFHPEKDEWWKRQAALEVCSSCPVRDDCLAEVLARPVNPVGVIGGTSENERNALRRQITPTCVDCGVEVARLSTGHGLSRCDDCATVFRRRQQQASADNRKRLGPEVPHLPCVVCGVTNASQGHDRSTDPTCGRWECRSALRRRRSNAVVWADDGPCDGDDMDDEGAVA